MTRCIGKKVPLFTGKAVQGKTKVVSWSTKQYIGKKWVLFFYPWDYSFACPKELEYFCYYAKDFAALDTEVVVSMAKDPYVVQAFLQSCSEGCSLATLPFPIVADEGGVLARFFSVYTQEEVCWRASFFIDEVGTVRQEIVNDLAILRSPQETLRTIYDWQAREV